MKRLGPGIYRAYPRRDVAVLAYSIEQLSNCQFLTQQMQSGELPQNPLGVTYDGKFWAVHQTHPAYYYTALYESH